MARHTYLGAHRRCRLGGAVARIDPGVRAIRMRDKVFRAGCGHAEIASPNDFKVLSFFAKWAAIGLPPNVEQCGHGKYPTV
jgi:hypothetical protein